MQEGKEFKVLSCTVNTRSAWALRPCIQRGRFWLLPGQEAGKKQAGLCGEEAEGCVRHVESGWDPTGTVAKCCVLAGVSAVSFSR